MTKKFLSILLCSLMAAPTLSMGGPAPTTPPSATATAAAPHFPDAAFHAGVSASRVVFSTDLERNDPDDTAFGTSVQSGQGNQGGPGFLDGIRWIMGALSVFLLGLALYEMGKEEAEEDE